MSGDSNQTLFNSDVLPAAKALVLRYKEQEVTVQSTDIPFTIGRDAECNFVVGVEFASRVHCKVLYHNKNFFLKDDSTNGTFVRIGVAQPVQLSKSMTSLSGSGSIKLGKAMAVGDKDVISFQVQL